MKADEPRQNRIPFMMSDAELKEVDDWRFANRVGTRADAIRRLVQIGIIADQNVDPLARAVSDARNAISDSLEELVKASDGFIHSDLEEPVRHYFARSATAAISVVDQLNLLSVVINAILRQVVATRSATDMRDARLAALVEKVRGIEKVSEAILEIYQSSKSTISDQQDEAPE